MRGAPDLLLHTEASERIGHGHLVRCLALAEGARARGLHVAFVCRDAYTHEALVARGEEPREAGSAGDAPFAALDFRGGAPDELVERLKARGARVLSFDDPGPARLRADIVVDAFMTARRRVRLPHAPATRYLYGIAYAPLDRRFAGRHGTARPGRVSAPRLFVSFGGRDPDRVTTRLVEALGRAGFRGPAYVVCDPEPDARAGVEALVRGWDDTEVACDVRDMATPMARADLVATKMGMSVLEALCLGLACVLLEPTPAHVDLHGDVALEHAPFPAWECGLAAEADFAAAAGTVCARLADARGLAEAGARGAALVDGRGVGRILDALVGPAGGGAP